MHTLGGAPPHGTELIKARIRNTLCGRQKRFLPHGLVSLVITYCKMQNGKVPRPVARFLDRVTSEFTLLYILVVLQSRQSLAVEAVYGSSRASEDYLFTKKGDVMGNSGLYNAFFKKMTEEKTPLTVRSYRCYQFGIAQCFLPKLATQYPFAQGAEHFKAGHTPSTAHRRYAVTNLEFDHLTSRELDSYHHISFSFHLLVGISSGTIGMPV